MAKIFIYIFSVLFCNSLVVAESISKKELSILKQNCIKLYKEKNYKNAIPELEKYLNYRDEVQFKIYLAKILFFRDDLQIPLEEDDAFTKKEKRELILQNYNRAGKLFEESVRYLEQINSSNNELANLYFLWAFSEYYGENKEKSISLFKKSAKLNPDRKIISNFNIAMIYEELGQVKDSKIYFKKSLMDN